uniref:Variant surface glycoprotein 734 n=1 Tax=Trypanosoma brucei TaxID=5691 RepID=M4SZ01_9TRYP|nr:variant surface glycoprotein 734 [Trypanosoma brucei]
MKTLTVASIWLLTIGAAANIDRGENRLEHAALCNLVALTDGTVDIPVVPPVDLTTCQYIQNLNFSAASQEWQDSFYKGDTGKVHDDAQPYHKAFKGHEIYWAGWKAAAAAAKEQTPEPAKKEAGVLALSAATRQHAKRRLQRVAEAAHKLCTASPALSPEQITLDGSKELTKIKAAVFGNPAKDRSSATTNEAFGATPGNARATACAADQANGKAKTVAALLSCICTKGAGTATAANPVCTDKTDGSTGWQEGTGPVPDTDLRAVLKTCASGKGQLITAQRLRAAVEAVRTLMTEDSGAGYLGKFKSTSCNGSSGNGVCVSFAAYGTGPADAFAKLGWPAQLTKLAEDMEDRKTAAAASAQSNAMLRQLADQARAVVDEAEEAAASQRDGTITNGKTKSNVKTAPCSAKTNTTCTRAGCKWEGTSETEGACKPKDREGQTVTEAAKETQCARHTGDRTACENDKTGDKQNCAWRKEKDKDPELENEMCRNGSL